MDTCKMQVMHKFVLVDFRSGLVLLELMFMAIIAMLPQKKKRGRGRILTEDQNNNGAATVFTTV
jgi:hypothetical protein